MERNPLLEPEAPPRFSLLRSRALFFVISMINQLGYTLTLCAAKDIATISNNRNKMPIFSGSLVVFALFIYLFSGRFLVKYPHKSRIIATIFFIILGICTIIFAIYSLSFGVAIAGSIFLGIGTILGASTNLGFLKAFPPETVTGWTSGSGLAGVLASLLYLVIKLLKFNPIYPFMFLLPLYSLYLVCFWKLSKQQLLGRGVYESTPLRLVPRDTDQTNSLESNQALLNDELKWSNFCVFFRLVRDRSPFLMMIYFFEYSCIGYLANVLVDRDKNGRSMHVAFEVIQLMYQVGVFIGRTIFQFLKIKRVWVLALIQGLFFLGWIATVFIFQEVNMPYLYASIFFIGLVGGVSYGTVVYLILNDPMIPYSKKEACINLNGAGIEMGIIINSLVGMLFIANLRHLNSFFHSA